MAIIRPFINSCKKRAVLAALLALIAAAPSWARVDIWYNEVDDYEVIISFTNDDLSNLIRAFAFDIQFGNDVNIIEVTGLSTDYHIYPGTIWIDAQGNVMDFGTPVAEYSDLPSGTRPGLDSNSITIEMASLYAPVGPGSPNAPAQSGDLLSIRVSGEFCVIPSYAGCVPDSEYCCLTMSGNVARAGSTGVVMEDPNEVVEVYFHNICYSPPPGCMEDTSPYYEDWIDLDCPECWCYPRQCYGDADGMMHGTPIGGYFWVGIPDLNILVSAWMVKEPPKGAGIESVPNGICADFDHTQHGTPIGGYFRVGIPDLNILVASWMVKEPPKGPGVPPDCLNLP